MSLGLIMSSMSAGTDDTAGLQCSTSPFIIGSIMGAGPELPLRVDASSASVPQCMGTSGCEKSRTSSDAWRFLTIHSPEVSRWATRYDLPPGPKLEAFTAGILLLKTLSPGPDPSKVPTFHCDSRSGGKSLSMSTSHVTRSDLHKSKWSSGGSSHSSIGGGFHSAAANCGCPHLSAMSFRVAITTTLFLNWGDQVPLHCGGHAP